MNRAVDRGNKGAPRKSFGKLALTGLAKDSTLGKEPRGNIGAPPSWLDQEPPVEDEGKGWAAKALGFRTWATSRTPVAL